MFLSALVLRASAPVMDPSEKETNEDDPEVIETDSNENDETQNNSTADEVSVLDTKKRKKDGEVWNCLTPLKGGGGKCNFCDKQFPMKQGSTSNANRHLLSSHFNEDAVKALEESLKAKQQTKKAKIEEEKKKLASQPSLTSMIARKGHIDKIKSAKIDAVIIKWIIKSNKAFSVVQDADFRRMMFEAQPNYLCLSRKVVTEKFDKMSEDVTSKLKKEIVEDVSKAGHYTIHLMSDHGTSNDVLKTKKNVLILARTTDKMEIKTDTVALIPSIGSQTGLQIRKDIKEAVTSAAGYDPSWTVCWVTDGAANAKNARKPGAHSSVGFSVHLDGTCVDHKFDLVGGDTLNAKDPLDKTQFLFPYLNAAVSKMKTFVNFLGDSALPRQAMHDLMIENDWDPLRTVTGTANRFFTKYYEVERFCELKEAVELFCSHYENLPEKVKALEFYEWDSLKVYRDSMELVVKASTMLEGRDYPTASSVIPFLDTIVDDLEELQEKCIDRDDKRYVKELIQNIKSDNRFGKDLYKTLPPYNCLTLLDPRYGKLYFNEEQLNKAVEDICKDKVFSSERGAESSSSSPVASQLPASTSTVSSSSSSFEKRRQKLLAATMQRENIVVDLNQNLSLKDRIMKELDKLFEQMVNVTVKTDVMAWYREHSKEFPLLTKYWQPYSSFPATSCSAERVFNVDGCIITNNRYISCIFQILTFSD